MCKTSKILIGFATVLMWTAGAGFGQSLGDVARQQRQDQQAKKDQAAPKVITNEDLPEHGEAGSDSGKSDHSHEPEPHHTGSRSAEQWRAQIEAQKHSIATLQAQTERLNSSIHFVEANRYYNGVQFNQRQEQRQEQVQRMQDQLEQQRKRLDDMQEAARKDGFGNAVYDP